MNHRTIRTSVAATGLVACWLSSATPASAASNRLQYYGGPVVANAQVVAVFWGPTVDSDIQNSIGDFYQKVLNSSYIDLLTEYDTVGISAVGDGKAGTAQHIGRGNFVAAVTITPKNTSQTLKDVDIASEIASHIADGSLPPPTYDAHNWPNTIYMVDFGPGMTLISSEGQYFCKDVCGWHNSAYINGNEFLFGVFGNNRDCLTGARCGGGDAQFAHATGIHGHELAGIITDPEALSVTPNREARAAWVGPTAAGSAAGEVVDLCFTSFTDGNSYEYVNGYAVEREWSNRLGACVCDMGIAGGNPPASPVGWSCDAGVPVGAYGYDASATDASADAPDGSSVAIDVDAWVSGAYGTASGTWIGNGSSGTSVSASPPAGQSGCSAAGSGDPDQFAAVLFATLGLLVARVRALRSRPNR